MNIDMCYPEHKCKFCGELLTDNNWLKCHKKVNRHICKECSRKRGKNQYEKHRENYLRRHSDWLKKNRKLDREYQRKMNHATKIEVLIHYSGGLAEKPMCVRCGFDDVRALSVDHINNDGSVHRQKFKLSSGHMMYYWLKKNNYPEGFQTLCMNCQFIKKSLENKKK